MAALGAVNAIACVPTVRFGPERQSTVWPVELGGARHDPSATEHLGPAPRAQWRAVAGRAVRGVPAIGESVIALGTVDRLVSLVSRDSGIVLWQHRLGGTIHGGPLLRGDRVYAGTEASPDGKVYALTLKTGKQVWSTRVGSVEAPLALDDTALYAGTEEGLVVRIDARSGAIAWRRRLAGAVRAAPVPSTAGLAVVTTDDSLYLLKPETGEVLARRGTPGAVLATPVQDGDRLYLATTRGQVVAVALPSLATVWERTAGDAVYGAPALVRDTLFVLARNGALWLVPVATPAAARCLDLHVVATAGPTPLADGTVLIGTVQGELLLVAAATGTIAWRDSLAGPIEQPPLVRDGQLLVVAGRGDLHAYR